MKKTEQLENISLKELVDNINLLNKKERSNSKKCFILKDSTFSEPVICFYEEPNPETLKIPDPYYFSDDGKITNKSRTISSVYHGFKYYWLKSPLEPNT